MIKAALGRAAFQQSLEPKNR